MSTLTKNIKEERKQLLFRKADQHLLNHMEARIKARKPTFLSSLNPLFEETVQVSYMLSILLSSRERDSLYKSFFCNSHMEALHGAIKMARSFQHDYKRHPGIGNVLLFDQNEYYEKYFDPLGTKDERALIPGVTFVADHEELKLHIAGNSYGILILSLNPPFIFEDLGDIITKSSGMVTILDISHWGMEHIVTLTDHIKDIFDIVVWGEALTDFQAPFGAFSTRKSVYASWNSLKNCLLHSTTYGGNGMVLSFVKANLIKAFPFFIQERKQVSILNRVERSSAVKLKLAKKYMNTYISVIYRSAKLDINMKKAEGFYITVKNSLGKQYRVMDCVGGSGCNFRGHNPGDVIPEVLHEHQPGKDYFSLLTDKLAALTGIPHVFPAISGASAVEIGMIIAGLANPSKTRVLIFTGNYAGKTLLALAGTHSDHSKFKPLYHNVTICNPFTPSGEEDLLKVLETGDVGMVWFERFQGTGLRAVPAGIISMVDRYKSVYGYLVGVDEVLTGVYRTGAFLSISNEAITPDIVTLSKGLSDMVFPVAVALVTGDVYDKAFHQNQPMVTFLEGLYKNQLGAHIAWHALGKAETEGIPGNVREVAPYLARELNTLAQQSKLFKSVEGTGLYLRLHMKMDKFPFKLFGYWRSSLIVTSVFYRQSKILTFVTRFVPPLNLSRVEAQGIVDGAQKTFNKPAFHFFLVGITQWIISHWMVFVNKFRRY
jgi:acetylornithine/succinyldiaminopimelate/putrescine aminotransferase